MDTARRELEDIQEHLQPGLVRARALARLDDLFAAGTVPDPLPDGFLEGRLVVVSVSEIADWVVRRLAALHMPWLGKSFSHAAGRGVNVLTKQARVLMRVALPSYVFERELADRIEALPFKTWVGPGTIDSGTQVLKVDYDIDGNPGLVRRILDELVQIDDGLYLGKVLLRPQLTYRQVGFFTLQSGAR